jgi:hypothetical protein
MGTNGDSNSSAAIAFSCCGFEQHAQSFALGAVADLIVILRAHHQLIRPDAARRPAVMALSMHRILALIDVTFAQRLGQVLETAEIGVIPGRLAGEEAMHGVVKVIAPMGVQPQAALRDGPDQARIVEVALGNHDQVAARLLRQLLHFRGQLFEHMDGLEAEDGMHRIQPQAVELIVIEPHQRIVDHEAAHLVAVRAVVVDRRAPPGLVAIREVGSELADVVAVGAKWL